MALNLLSKLSKLGRKKNEPKRDTVPFPQFMLFGQSQNDRRSAFKPIPRNLRYFAKTPFARRAISAIKSPIAGARWEIRPKHGVTMNAELRRQIDLVTHCLHSPNNDDSFRSFLEQIIEDILCGAGAYEQHLSGDPERPLWLWPVDGLAIQIWPNWDGSSTAPRYRQVIGYGGYGAAGGSEGVDLTDSELVYIKPNPTTATPFGLGHLETAFMTISRKLAVEDFAGNVSGNASPSRILHMGENVDREAVLAFRSYFENELEGQGKLPILGGTVKPSVLDLKPDGDSALYLAYQDLLTREIAVSFNLDQSCLGMSQETSRDTSEAAEDRNYDHAVKPVADTVAAYLTRKTINGLLGFSQIEFAFVSMDRKDEKAAADIAFKYYQMNVLVPDEIRKTMGLDPADNVWGALTYADFQISMMAARGAKVIDDPDEPTLETSPGDAFTPDEKNPSGQYIDIAKQVTPMPQAKPGAPKKGT